MPATRPLITTEASIARSITRRDDLPGPAGARVFTGTEHGGVPISLFLIDDEPGGGPALHRHPYPELFVVHAGRAEFELDGERVLATGGDVLVAHAGVAHRFTNVGTGRLQLTAIHAAARMQTEWLEPTERR
jgi:quercetin dioxygenase-like cupin family protein